MATMNLRVSCKGKAKKNLTQLAFRSHLKNLRGLILEEICGPSLIGESKSLLTDVSKILLSSSPEKQLAALKKISNLSELDYSNQLHFFKILTMLFFTLDTQCPLKPAVLKLLESVEEKSGVAKELQKQLEMSMTATNASENIVDIPVSLMQEQGHVASCILQLARTKNLAGPVLLPCWVNVMIFLQTSSKDHLSLLNSKKQTSPVEQQEIFTGFHTLSQASVAVLQIYSKCSSLNLDSQDLQLKKSENTNVLIKLAEVFVLSMSEPPSQLPSDTQNTCAMILALITNHSDVVIPDYKGDCNILIFYALKGCAPCKASPWNKLEGCSASARVSLCAALLSFLATEHLVFKLPMCNDSPVLLSIFQYLTSLTGRSCEPQLLLGTCRAMAGVGRVLSHVVQISPDLLSKIMPGALEYGLSHLEHNMDSVRHAARGFLDSIILVARDRPELDLIISAVRKLPKDCKARFTATIALTGHLGTLRMLNVFPGLMEWVLEALQNTRPTTYACSLLETLMSKHRCSDVSSQEWCEQWVVPLLALVPSCDYIEPVLAKAVELCPDTLSFILNQQEFELSSTESLMSTNKLKIILNCLKVAQKCRALSQDREEFWCGVLDWKILRMAMAHSEDEVRLAALSLLIETNKSTELLAQEELDLILVGFACCGDSHSPSTQHKAIGLLKKLLARLIDSGRNLLKQRKSTVPYSSFLVELCKSFYSGLFPGSSVGRHTLGLQSLVLVAKVLPQTEPWAQVWTSLHTRDHAQALFACLNDSYDNNKSLAAYLLNSFPTTALGFDEPEIVTGLLETSLEMSESCKPPDCQTAAHVISVLVMKPSCLPILQDVAKSSDSACLAMCKMLVLRLEMQLKVARQSILQAAAQGPMYGTLFCIRHLLVSTDLQLLSQDKREGNSWKMLVDHLVDLCFQLNDVVAPIVNSSSPEGHLPMDFESDLSESFQTSVKIGEDEHKTDIQSNPVRVTAQMVLLCSWRTVKEVSLLLGDLAAQAPAKETTEYLLSNQQLITIGEHFTSLLCETKHRGAFEQAYVGFCKLCAWLWRVPDGELPQLPSLWLDELMTAISCEEDKEEGVTPPRLGSKLCATRRSAGVPFIVQALVTTELEVREKPECFPSTVGKLLALAQCAGTEVQVHALNILRALFKSSKLGDHVSPYVAQGFEVAITAFKGESWAERNAATLLYSALIIRVFGVKHTPGLEDLPRKNRMTGRIFFRLYPTLYELLLKELKEGVETISKGGQEASHTPALFPVLLLLARLYPSSLEGTDTSLNLLYLRDKVVACASSPIYHIRKHAACAVVSLLDPSEAPQFVHELRILPFHTYDQLHGTLVQLIGVVQETPPSRELSFVLTKKIQEGMVLLEPQEHHYDVTRWSFVCFFSEVLTQSPASITPGLAATVQEKLKILLVSPSGTGNFSLKSKCASLLLQLSVIYHSDKIEETLLSLLEHPLKEVVHEGLVFLLSNTLKDKDEILGDASVVLELKSLSESECMGSWNMQVKESLPLAKCIIFLATKFTCELGQVVGKETRSAVFLALARLARPALSLQWPKFLCKQTEPFLQGVEHALSEMLSLEEREKWGTANHFVLACCGELIHAWGNDVPEKLLKQYCLSLLRNTDPDGYDEAKLVAAQSLCRNKNLLFNSNVHNRCLVYFAAMALLQDENTEVQCTITHLWPWLSVVARTQALHSLAMYFTQELSSLDLQACLATLLTWALGDLMLSPNSEELILEDIIKEHKCVFDKEEPGAFLEEKILADTAACALQSLVINKKHADIIDALTRPLEWLPTPTSPSHGASLQILLKRACSVPKVAHFLHPSYAKTYLMNYRAMQVRKVFSAFDIFL